mmetsp:Transcript_29653/g.83629  ORF Transcript_29653/g.83629 Transcript_29653/m.83629 type:complete len:232 (+) Transcript_29653:510-1205(+)
MLVRSSLSIIGKVSMGPLSSKIGSSSSRASATHPGEEALPDVTWTPRGASARAVCTAPRWGACDASARSCSADTSSPPATWTRVPTRGCRKPLVNVSWAAGAEPRMHAAAWNSGMSALLRASAKAPTAFRRSSAPSVRWPNASRDHSTWASGTEAKSESMPSTASEIAAIMTSLLKRRMASAQASSPTSLGVHCPTLRVSSAVAASIIFFSWIPARANARSRDVSSDVLKS